MLYRSEALLVTMGVANLAPRAINPNSTSALSSRTGTPRSSRAGTPCAHAGGAANSAAAKPASTRCLIFIMVPPQQREIRMEALYFVRAKTGGCGSIKLSSR